MMSRIYRFLSCEIPIEDWKVVGYEIWLRDIFDHCHMWVKVNNIKWGPKPFTINNCWFEHINFKLFVERE